MVFFSLPWRNQRGALIFFFSFLEATYAEESVLVRYEFTDFTLNRATTGIVQMQTHVYRDYIKVKNALIFELNDATYNVFYKR